ncbi:Homoserine O-acetyltransferase [Frankliniella fusca]|uniref:Homoserine O-acetyltransferase n=1 Tax=Frankliniella fusca TaxID=407009 RepID=A0AAE1GRC1_9NEOP|nr:Homoserine O-acetyltransferase [Frankliniella fusca]
MFQDCCNMERLRSMFKNRPRETQWKCCVTLCGEKKTSDNHLHCVPQDEKRRNSWGCALGMNLKPSHRVYNEHFKEEDYIPTSGCGLRPNLKRTAIPSSVPVPVQSVNDVIDEDEMLRRREVLKEFEAVPSHMTVFPEDLPALQEEARNLLCCISSKECCLFVESYIEDSRNEHSSVFLDGGLGPFHLFPDMAN